MSLLSMSVIVAAMVSTLNNAEKEIPQYTAPESVTVAADSAYNSLMSRLNDIENKRKTHTPGTPLNNGNIADFIVPQNSALLNTTENNALVQPSPPPAHMADLIDEQGNLKPGTNWYKLAQCESSLNPSVVDSTGLYSGLFQFDVPTWNGYGGGQYAPSAGQATPQQQLEIAMKLHEARGWQPWPVCGARLG